MLSSCHNVSILIYVSTSTTKSARFRQPLTLLRDLPQPSSLIKSEVTETQSEPTWPLIHNHRGAQPDGTPLYNSDHSKHASVRLGYFLFFLASIAFACNSVLVRVSESRFAVPSVMILFLRGLTHTTFAILYFVFSYSPADLFKWRLSRHQTILLFFRGVAGTFSLLSFFTSVKMVHVGDAISVFFLHPIFVFILASIFLSEAVTFKGVVAIVLSSAGTVLIAFGQQNDTDDSLILTTELSGWSLCLSALFRPLSPSSRSVHLVCP